MGSKGDSYGNALAETINGLYKADLIHRQAPWKTKESLKLATLQWVHGYNHTRQLEPIGKKPPVESEANYYRLLAEQSTVATTTLTKQPPRNPGRFSLYFQLVHLSGELTQSSGMRHLIKPTLALTKIPH